MYSKFGEFTIGIIHSKTCLTHFTYVFKIRRIYNWYHTLHIAWRDFMPLKGQNKKYHQKRAILRSPAKKGQYSEVSPKKGEIFKYRLFMARLESIALFWRDLKILPFPSQKCHASLHDMVYQGGVCNLLHVAL